MEIKVRELTIGGDYISVQSMIKNSPYDIDLTLKKITNLHNIGCDIIRITVPDMKAVDALKEIVTLSPIPVVADIHFDYRLAIKSIEAGVDKVRINPGNIGDKDRVKKVIDCLKEYNIPARIGINKGSLPAHLKSKYKDPVKIMLEAAREEVGYFAEEGYHNLVLSFKSSNVLETIAINRLAAETFPYPLHIGITEAGDYIDGAIKNSAGLSILLLEGIGNTIRVSLTAPEEREVVVGQKILEAVGKRIPLVEVISCPTCGRTEVDIASVVEMLKSRISGKRFTKRLKIAVMGCVVNGPGEAEECDFGIACGKEHSILFKDGKKIKTIKNKLIMDEIIVLLEGYYEN